MTTSGFKDLIEIGRQTRPKIYDLKADNPEPLVLRQHRFEVAERIGPKGEVITPLNDADIARVIADVQRSGADSVAVCFLFSFLNPAHEQRVGAALRAALPQCEVSLSCEVQPEFREYERLSTTVLNAFLQPVVGRYMANLQAALAQRAPGARIGISQSSGGLMSIARAAHLPIRTALSGPAAGVVGAIAVGARSGHQDIVTFDMGGTSTDVCLVQGGRAEMSFGRNVASFPVRLPSIDIHTVGAGGGSIAFIDKDGLLKVGPRSAGAVPGPACYGLGGTEPTVTDANIVLGRLPARLAGGGMRLDRVPRGSCRRRLGKPLGMGPIETALGIVRIVNSNMVRAIRAVSIERGHDPRLFTLMPFGGAGALHAVDVARELRMSKILVPPAPGILCAEGVASANLEEGFVATCRTPLRGDLSIVTAAMGRLQDEAGAWFEREAIETADRRRELVLDMRYIGQNFELPVPVSIDPSRCALACGTDAKHSSPFTKPSTGMPIPTRRSRSSICVCWPAPRGPACTMRQGPWHPRKPLPASNCKETRIRSGSMPAGRTLPWSSSAMRCRPAPLSINPPSSHSSTPPPSCPRAAVSPCSIAAAC